MQRIGTKLVVGTGLLDGHRRPRLAGRRSAPTSPYWPDIVWRMVLMASGMAPHDGAGHRVDHGLAAAGQGGRRLGGERHHPPGRRRARRRHHRQRARVDLRLPGGRLPAGQAGAERHRRSSSSSRSGSRSPAGKQVPGLATTAIDGVHRRHARGCARCRRRGLRRCDHRVRVAAGPRQLRRARRRRADTAARRAGRHGLGGRVDGRRRSWTCPRSSAEDERRGAAPPGRPRSAEADEAILEAAVELFAEVGLEGLTVEGVAAARGRGQGHDLPPVPVQGRPRGGGRPLLHAGPGASRPTPARRAATCASSSTASIAILTTTPLGRVLPILVAARTRVAELDRRLRRHRRREAGARARSSSGGPSSAATSAPTSTPSW